MKIIRVALMILLATAMTGCAKDKREKLLDSALHQYERSLKWGNFSDARMIAGEPEAQDQNDPYKEIKVISYEVVRQEIVGDLQQLNQVVEIKFYHEQQAKIRTLRDTQVWVYDEERTTWVLKSGFPDFLSALE